MSSLFKSVEIDRLRRFIKSFGTFALVTHVFPDGDAIGAMQGFAAFLRALGKSAYAMVPNSYPDYLAFLDSSHEDKILIYKHKQNTCERALREAEVIICFDMNALKRLEGLGDLIETMEQPRLVIDHHPEPEQEKFDLIISRPEMSSSCELVYRIICALDMVDPFPHGAVEPLYVGIMTDTNNFSNMVTAGTFEAAADLLRLGARKEEVQKYVFGAFSEQRMRFMAHAILNRMVLIKPYRTAYMALSLAEQDQYGFRTGDSEGFVNIPINIKDVDISMLFVETPNYIRVSLRSRNGVEVHEMAGRFFNGGGHRQAAGGKLYCSFAELPGIILHALEETFGKIPLPLAR